MSGELGGKPAELFPDVRMLQFALVCDSPEGVAGTLGIEIANGLKLVNNTISAGYQFCVAPGLCPVYVRAPSSRGTSSYLASILNIFVDLRIPVATPHSSC